MQIPEFLNIRSAARILPILVLASISANATTVEPPNFSELVAEADFVVDGEISAVRTELVESAGRRLVFTHVSVEIIETIAGNPPEALELKVLGGAVGDYAVRVEGVPEFHVGDRDVLFVVGNGAQFCPLVAIMHGRYPIVPRPGDGIDIVLRTNGEPLAVPADVRRPLAHGSRGPVTRVEASVADAMTLDAFKASIREEVSRGVAK